MDTVSKLKTYRVTYKTVSSNGILGIIDNTCTIEAQNNDDALVCIRKKALSDGNSGIRVVRIQRLDEEPKQEIKKTKSMWGWLFSFIFIGAMLAKVAGNLF